MNGQKITIDVWSERLFALVVTFGWLWPLSVGAAAAIVTGIPLDFVHGAGLAVIVEGALLARLASVGPQKQAFAQGRGSAE